MTQDERVKELMSRVCSRDEDALIELINLFRPLKSWLTLLKSGPMVESWDIEQEVDIAIYTACLEFDDSKMMSPIAYIDIRVRQAIAKYLRQIKLDGWFDCTASGGMDIEEYEDFLGINDFLNLSSEDEYFGVWHFSELMNSLTDKQKIVVFYSLHKFSQEEIAEMLGITQQAVSKHLLQARKIIQEKCVELGITGVDLS